MVRLPVYLDLSFSPIAFIFSNPFSCILSPPLTRSYEGKQAKLTEKRISLKAELNDVIYNTDHISDVIDNLKVRICIISLDRETVVELVDHIENFRKEKSFNKYIQRIDIYFNFIGRIDFNGFDNLNNYIKEKASKIQNKKTTGQINLHKNSQGTFIPCENGGGI